MSKSTNEEMRTLRQPGERRAYARENKLLRDLLARERAFLKAYESKWKRLQRERDHARKQVRQAKHFLLFIFVAILGYLCCYVGLYLMGALRPVL